MKPGIHLALGEHLMCSDTEFLVTLALIYIYIVKYEVISAIRS